MEGAVARARLAMAADPQWHVPHWLMVYVALDAGDLSVAEAEMDTVERLAPSSVQATWVALFRGRLQFLRGDTVAVRESIRLSRARGGEGGAAFLEGLLWARRGHRDSTAAIATRFERESPLGQGNTFNDVHAALLWLAAGDSTRAFQALARRPQVITWPPRSGPRRAPRQPPLRGGAGGRAAEGQS